MKRKTMATIFTHAFVASAIGRLQQPCLWTARFWVLSIICSILPDADVIGYLGGVEYGSVFGHRGITHSLSFALVVAVLVVSWGFPTTQRGSKTWWVLVAHFFVVTASHGVLDALTNGGLGVAFFAPFDNARYFFPWRPIIVSPLGSGFFGLRGLKVLASEFLLIWLPILLIARGIWVLRLSGQNQRLLMAEVKGGRIHERGKVHRPT